MAEVGGLAVAQVLAKKIFFNPSLEILTPFRINLLIWPSLYIYDPYSFAILWFESRHQRDWHKTLTKVLKRIKGD